MITSSDPASKTNKPQTNLYNHVQMADYPSRGRTLCFETGSYFAAQDDLQLVVLLPQPPHSKLTSERTTLS